MMDMFEKVNSLADGQLSESESAEIKNQLENDPQAQNEYLWAQALKSTLREKAVEHNDSELWKSCRARLRAVEKTQKVEHYVGRFAWAMCLIFFVGILSAATLNRMWGSRPLTSAHVAGLLDGLSPARISEVGDALSKLGERVGSQSIADLSSAQLISMYLGMIDGRKAAKLTYRDEHGDFNLYVVAGTSSIEGIDKSNGEFSEGMINEANAVSWKSDENLFLLVSKRSSEDLRAIAAQIKSSSR